MLTTRVVLCSTIAQRAMEDVLRFAPTLAQGRQPAVAIVDIHSMPTARAARPLTTARHQMVAAIRIVPIQDPEHRPAAATPATH